MLGVKYGEGHRFYMNEVSEWWCTKCATRFGRWCHKPLTGNEVEPRAGCKGFSHPIIVNLYEEDGE